jgi:hypothetical protein
MGKTKPMGEGHSQNVSLDLTIASCHSFILGLLFLEFLHLEVFTIQEIIVDKHSNNTFLFGIPLGNFYHFSKICVG